MKSWVRFVTLGQHLLARLEEIDERRVSLEQVLRVSQVDTADRKIVLPVLKGLQRRINER